MLFGLLVVILALLSLVLIMVVLLQSGKGGGLSGIGAGGTTQILGARQAPDALEKITWGLGAVFALLCILSSFVIEREQDVNVLDGVQTEQTVPAPAPAAPVTPAPGDSE
jgi:preprotein translocase subunit SecG